MKTVAGAIVLLAGATAFASVVVADAILTAAAKNTAWLLPCYGLGGILGLIGLVLLVAGCLLDRDAH